MWEILERIFPIISNGQTTVDRTWNLYDIFNFIEFCAFMTVRSVVGTCFAILGEIAKFALILLIVYAFALATFRYMDYMTTTESSNKKKSALTLKRPSDFQAYPYIVHYPSKFDNEYNKFRSVSVTTNRTVSMDSDPSEDDVVRIGSFKRSVAGEKSIIGKALEDLINTEVKVLKKESMLIESESTIDDHEKEIIVGQGELKGLE